MAVVADAPAPYPAAMIAALLLGLLQAASGSSADAAREWAEFPVPALSSEPSGGLELLPLRDGVHVVLNDDRDERRTGASAAGSLQSGAGGHRLPLSLLTELLEDDARRRGETLRVLRPAPPLIATGDAAALARARATCAALDEAARRQEIRLAVWLVPAAGGSSGVLAPGTGPSGPPQHVATVRSGEAARFGERVEQAFLATYRADVAADSEVADPVFGSARTGRTLHLTAWRVEGGRALLVEGFLDLAELAALDPYDTGSPDLGLIQRPTVRSVQVRFGGRVESGGRLAVAIEGAPLAAPAWTVVVEARTDPDEPRHDQPWRVVDVALLESPMRSLELPSPGLGPSSGGLVDLPGTTLEPLGALSIWGQVQAASADRRGPLPQGHALPGLLIAPAAERGFWERAEALIAAAERARVATGLLEVRAGSLRVALPVYAGLSARVLVGEERTWIVDYEPQIAPEAWLAAPDVRRSFDGVLVQGRLDGGAFPLSWWRTSTRVPAALEPRDTTHGRLEPVRRSFRGDRARVRTGAEPELLDGSTTDGGPLTVGLTRP